MPRESRRRRKPNIGIIRLSLSYTVTEIAELFGCHVNTVRGWIASGLPTIDDNRPYLIHGADLYDFLKVRQISRRRTCASDEMYCFGCRQPRRSKSGSASIVNARRTTITVTGICSTCGTRMNRAASASGNDQVCEAFAIPPTGHQHLMEQSTPLDNCDLETEAHDGPI